MTAKRQGVLAIDQGTTSSRAIVFDLDGEAVSVAQQEFAQIFPEPGWVEHDPEAIWESVLATARQALKEAEAKGVAAQCIGLANQRETAIVWDKATGAPIHNAIVWQDRRTAEVCEALAAAGRETLVREKTGLVLDPYFSATKFSWLLDHADGARARAEKGELAFGTVDTFLIWRLTGGAAHVTDATNVSRTSLCDLATGAWDAGLLDIFNVPDAGLPEITPSAGRFGETLPELFGRSEQEVFERLQAPDAVAHLEGEVGGEIRTVLDAAELAVRLRRTGAAHLVRLREGLPPRLPVLYVPELFTRSHGARATRQVAEALGEELDT